MCTLPGPYKCYCYVDFIKASMLCKATNCCALNTNFYEQCRSELVSKFKIGLKIMCEHT